MPVASFPYPVGRAAIFLRTVVSTTKHCNIAVTLTFDMLNTEFLDQSWREHTGRKCTTEDGAKFGVQSTNTHVLELEVGSNDSIRRCSEQDMNTLE